jgi:tetratricopeptide (TPR) repeat protein
MVSRISVSLFSFAFALSCAGCVNTQTQDASPVGAKSTNMTKLTNSTPSIPRREDGVKRAAQPKTEIAFGQMKENDADSDAAKKNPEAQAHLRDEARQAYQAALKQDPNNADAYRHLARLYTKVGDYERAFDTYQKAMAKHPKDASLWYDLGLCHHRRKDLAESVKCFNKALEIEPENREYMKKLGFTIAYMGQTEQGLSLLTRAQGAALAHYGIARVLIQQGQNEQAQQHLKLALRENAQLESARELLAGLANPNPNVSQRGAIGDPQVARD